MKLKRKKVLVTGADGFIGSHLVETLLAHDCDVRAFVFYNAFNSWGWLDSLPSPQLKRIEVMAGDVRDFDNVMRAMQGAKAVFHLAALVGIPFSYRAPQSYADTNIKGTLNILTAAREQGVERLVVTSTSEVYGTARHVPIDENHPRQAQSPYAATKIASDALAMSFHRSFDLPVVIARPFNTYGPRQSARAVIPTIIAQLLAGGQDIRLGNLHPTRDLTYVEDICAAFLSIAECDKAIGQELNIGSGHEISIGALAKLICHSMALEARIVREPLRNRPKRSEVERLVCDAARVRRLTGWRPKVALAEGLQRTIAWFRNSSNLQRGKAKQYVV